MSEAEAWLEEGLQCEGGVGAELERLCEAATPFEPQTEPHDPHSTMIELSDAPTAGARSHSIEIIGTSEGSGFQTRRVRPAELRFTYNTLQRLFTCGRRVQDVAEDLHAGRVRPDSLPQIKVVLYDGKWYSVNNRRLWCLQFAEVGEVDAIVGDPNAHFLRGFNTKTDGRIVKWLPPLVCLVCNREFVNRSAYTSHTCHR